MTTIDTSTISIDDAIAQSRRRAKQLWLLSIAWALVMLAVAVVFGLTISKFNTTESELAALRFKADKLISDVTETQKHLEEIQRGLQEQRLTATKLIQQLQDTQRTVGLQSDELKALSLQAKAPDQLTDQEKDFIEAQAQADAAATETPTTVTNRAAREFIRRDYKRSYAIYTRALTNDSKFTEAYLGRANVDDALEYYDRELEDLTHALELENIPSRRPSTLLRRAKVFDKLSRVQEAEQDLAEAIQLGNALTKSSALEARGFIRLRQKDWEGAENDFRAAASLNPGQQRGERENIGLVYLAQSNWNAAYDLSVELSHESGQSGGWFWMIKAIASDKLGNMAERDAAVREFIKRYRDPKGATTELDKLGSYLPDDLSTLAKRWISSLTEGTRAPDR
jgi:tetratricopeptide (TPR) repeat protein